MSGKTNLGSSNIFLAIVLLVIFLMGFGVQARAEDDEGSCATTRNRWEQAVQDLKDKLAGFNAIQQTRVERLIQRPVINNSGGKTIARQIAEALQVKEDLLNAKRTECRNLLNSENQAFNEYQQCAGQENSKKGKKVKNVDKDRRALVEKVIMALAEVREVEGQETGMHYSQVYQDPYGRSVNQWQNYQQMQRGGWWGR